jgi:SAM-dependent methyltransferase
MTSVEPSPTFRDPAGSLTLQDDFAVRRIHPSAREAVLDFVGSAFYQRLQQRGDIVATTVDHDPAYGLRLLHPRIPIPTYPWEWTQSQWLAAAELTLKLCTEAIAEGWILKDATPLNILFIGPRPILVDVISFERRDPSSSIWLAYGQYMRTFLLPLLMNRMMAWPLELTFFKRDGYEPNELYQSMRWSQRLSSNAFWPITLPTWLDKRSGATAPVKPSTRRDPEFTAHILNKTLDGLLARTRRALPKDTASNWADYQTTLSHYSAEQGRQKHQWVQQVLADFSPRTVLDIGANTGEYSALAAASGATVVALERDAPAADRLFHLSRSRKLDIQTIHADLARPSPAAGWDNSESSALIPRLEAKSDLVMMLAVIHHLILMEQIPIPAIMALMHRLCRRHLIVEWVPVADPMYQSLMRGRDTLYGSLAEADLLNACAGRFNPIRRETLGNGRILFLFEKL